MKLWKKRDRRKDHATRRLIEENEVAVDDVREGVRELVATINGDPEWLCKRLLKTEKNRENQDGCNRSAVSDNCR